MATLDDSPALFTGQTWLAWANQADTNTPAEPEKVTKKPESGGGETNSMKLNREDMGLFGLCPAQDEFYLVVCERCGQVVKPQALKSHYEQRHGNLSSQKSTVSSPRVPKHVNESSSSKLSHSPLKTVTSSPSKTVSHTARKLIEHLPNKTLSPHREGQKHEVDSNTKLHRANNLSRDSPIPNSNELKQAMQKISKTNVPEVRLERIPSPIQKKSEHSHGPLQKPILTNNGAAGPGATTTVTVTETVISTAPQIITNAVVSKVVPSQVTLSVTPQTTVVTAVLTTKTTTAPVTVTTTTPTPSKPVKDQKYLPCKDREYDADKHCGVFCKETNRRCTRSLTCKSHALSLRRAVPGRIKPFDELLKEHRAAKEALLKAKQEAAAAAAAAKPIVSSAAVTTTTVTTTKTPGSMALTVTTASATKSTATVIGGTKPTTKAAARFISPAPLPRPISTITVPKQEPPHAPELLAYGSSDEEADDEAQDSSDYSYVPYHPKPAAVNTFGARLHGSGCYVFNRKSDLLRAAFRSTIDRHLQPPPKKRCLESKLPRDITHMADSKDPYEFNVVDNHANNKQGNKAKAKPLTSTNKISKPKDLPGIRSPTGGLLPNANRSQSSTMNNANPSKRKRSGSTPTIGGTPAFNISSSLTGASANPISIAIPGSSINLTLTSSNLTLTSNQLSSLNATIANKQAQLTSANRSNVLKDLSIVVTNIDSNIMNGQLVSIPSTTLMDGTRLQLSNVNLSNTQTDRTKLHKKASKSSKKAHNQDVHSKTTTAAANTVGIVNSLGQQQATILAPASFMLNPGGQHVMVSNNSITSPAVQTSPLSAAPSPLRSGSTSPPLPSDNLNGLMLPSSMGVKSFTIGVNHANSVGESPSSSTNSPSPHPASDDNLPTANATTRSLGKSHGSRHSSTKASQGAQRIITHQLGQPLAAAISLTMAPGGRLIPAATNSFQQVYANQVLGNIGTFGHIQIQPKQAVSAGSKGSDTTAKVPLQPFSVTIPIVAPATLEGVPAPDSQPQTVFLQDTSDQSQVPSSPSNVLS